MAESTRREFLGATASAVAAGRLSVAGTGRGAPVPVLHATDLFRPPVDPDDHWDLATVFALAFRKDVDLLGVLIDHPRQEWARDPDVLAVAQLNHLTGQAVPAVVGTPRKVEPADAGRPENAAAVRGVRAFLDLLRRSPRPAVVHVVGSCRDVALAARLEPELFARQCRGLYLNAGGSRFDDAKPVPLEYNVQLDPGSYAAIFELRCPVYWMPCFEVPPEMRVGEYATYYRFRQGDVLAKLSPGLRQYFASVFRDTGGPKTPSADWLRFLEATPDRDLQARVAAMDRNMWCTAGFLHAAGLGVTAAGEIVPWDQARESVFGFEPVRVTCTRAGVTRWHKDPTSTDRFLFHVRDRERYQAAMTKALVSLLAAVP